MKEKKSPINKAALASLKTDKSKIKNKTGQTKNKKVKPLRKEMKLEDQFKYEL